MTWPTIYVQAAFGADPRDSAQSHAYTDLATYVTGLTVDSPKRTRLLDSFSAGSTSLTLDNSDGRFDPTNLSGPYVSGGRTQIVPNLPLRVYVDYASTDHYLSVTFRDRGRVVSQFPQYSEATWTATDAFKLLGRSRRTASSAVGADERSGTRIGRVLDSAGWNATDREVASGLVNVQATTLDGGVLEELQQVAQAEGGDVFVDGAGQVTFRDRSYRASTTTWTLDDSTDTEQSETVITDDDEQIINWASVARIGSTAQVAQDTTSQSRYALLGSPTWDRTGQLMMTDPDALAIAGMVVGLRSDTVTRFESVTVDPGVNDNLWPMVLGMQIGDRLTITETPVTGSAVTRTCFIEGWQHNIRPGNGGTQGQWSTTVTLSDASSWASLGLGAWDSAVWDTAKWFY